MWINNLKGKNWAVITLIILSCGLLISLSVVLQLFSLGPGTALLALACFLALFFGYRFYLKSITNLFGEVAGVIREFNSGGRGMRMKAQDDHTVSELAASFNKATGDLEDYTRSLEETRDYLASVLEYTGDMIITTDLNRKIVSFNKGGELMLGYTQDEVLGLDVEKLYHEPDERWALMRHVQDMGSISNYEVQLTHKDGHLLDISLTLSQLKDNQGHVIGTVGISKDITPHKEQEEKLRLQRIELQETRDYLANSGKISIQSRMTSDQNTVRVTVNDEGHGIPAENLSRIFDPFYSTKGQEGNGLGLSVVQTIIEKHEGSISVASQVGEGTTFSVLLPINSLGEEIQLEA